MKPTDATPKTPATCIDTRQMKGGHVAKYHPGIYASSTDPLHQNMPHLQFRLWDVQRTKSGMPAQACRPQSSPRLPNGRIPHHQSTHPLRPSQLWLWAVLRRTSGGPSTSHAPDSHTPPSPTSTQIDPDPRSADQPIFAGHPLYAIQFLNQVLTSGILNNLLESGCLQRFLDTHVQMDTETLQDHLNDYKLLDMETLRTVLTSPPVSQPRMRRQGSRHRLLFGLDHRPIPTALPEPLVPPTQFCSIPPARPITPPSWLTSESKFQSLSTSLPFHSISSGRYKTPDLQTPPSPPIPPPPCPPLPQRNSIPLYYHQQHLGHVPTLMDFQVFPTTSPDKTSQWSYTQPPIAPPVSSSPTLSPTTSSCQSLTSETSVDGLENVDWTTWGTPPDCWSAIFDLDIPSLRDSR
jgi:hypothetical protein